MKFFIFIFIFIIPLSLSAKGVRAGTVITNVAIMTFSVGDDTKQFLKSNEVSTTVLQLLSLSLNWNDTKPIKIYEGAKNKVLSCSLINNGNGNDLVVVKPNIESNLQNIVSKMSIFEDTNKNLKFDEDDREVVDFSLEPDEKKNFFLVTSLRDNSFTKEQNLNIKLKANSKRGGSGVKGKLHKGRGVNGIDAVDGINGGIAKKDIAYLLISQKPIFTKKVTKKDEGKYFLVELSANIKGNAQLDSVVIKDTIPQNLSYRKNTIKLNGHYLSDKKDSDAGYYDNRRKMVVFSLDQMVLPKNVLLSYIVEKEVL